MNQSTNTFLLLSALAGCSFTTAQAAVVAWDGGASGSWNTTTNWNPDGLPGNDADITISGATVSVD